MRYETNVFPMSTDPIGTEQQELETPYFLAREKLVASSEIGKAIVEIREIPGTEGFYNAAAWEVDGITYLLGRRVYKPGGYGEPDIGSLALLTLGPDGHIESSKEVWQPEPGKHLLEDPRALLLPEDKIVIGLTSVANEGRNYVPYPAVVVTSTEQLQVGLPEPKIITDQGAGDQTTPIGDKIDIAAGKNVTAIDAVSIMFRPEGPENNHRLRVFEYKEGQINHQQEDIKFPEDIAWAKNRIGTTMPPVWLNNYEAIFPIHGHTIAGDGTIVYSIGSARLVRGADGALSVDNISQEPLIHPDLFVEMFTDKEEIELHKERRVVYCCGGVPIYDERGNLGYLKLYVNVGDNRTFEVTISATKLTEGWQSGELVTPGQPLSEAA